jgi:hypothetical protein
MTFLFIEERGYRGRLIKYFGEWLLGRRRMWRRALPEPRDPRIIPRWRLALALLSGPLLYAQGNHVPAEEVEARSECCSRSA